MSTKVSIITPCYNSAEFLRPLWQSLVDQEYPDLEWIVVDDHSTDDSYAVLQELKDKGELSMQVLVNPGKGACAARNFGLSHSSGNWVKFLDSDDLLASGHIQAFVGEIENLPSTRGPILVGNTQLLFEEAGKPPVRIDTIPSLGNEREPLRYFIEKAEFHHSACLLPREVITPDNLWNEDLLADQDGNFLTRLFVKGVRVKIVDTPPFIYRQHDSPDRITARESAAKLKSRLASVEDIIVSMKKEGNYEENRESIAQKYEKVGLRAVRNFPDIANEALRKAEAIFPGYRSTLPFRRRLTRWVFGLRGSALFWSQINRSRMLLRRVRGL